MKIVVYCLLVFLPCRLVGIAIADEGTELLNCRSVEKKLIVESLPAHKINLDQFHADFRGKPRTQEGTTKTSDEEVSLQFVIMYAILLLILMVFSWGLGLWAFIFFTKRRSQCPPNPRHLLSSAGQPSLSRFDGFDAAV